MLIAAAESREEELRAPRAGPGHQAHQRPRSRAQSGEGRQCPVQRGGARPPKMLGPLIRGLTDLADSERTTCRFVGMNRSTLAS